MGGHRSRALQRPPRLPWGRPSWPAPLRVRLAALQLRAHWCPWYPIAPQRRSLQGRQDVAERRGTKRSEDPSRIALPGFFDPPSEYDLRRDKLYELLRRSTTAKQPDYINLRNNVILKFSTPGRLCHHQLRSVRSTLSQTMLPQIAKQNIKKRQFKEQWDKQHKEVVK